MGELCPRLCRALSSKDPLEYPVRVLQSCKMNDCKALKQNYFECKFFFFSSNTGPVIICWISQDMFFVTSGEWTDNRMAKFSTITINNKICWFSDCGYLIFLKSNRLSRQNCLALLVWKAERSITGTGGMSIQIRGHFLPSGAPRFENKTLKLENHF